MKKFTIMMLALFILEGTGQILGGVGQSVGGAVNAIVLNPANTVASDTARWAGHYEYVEQGNDASGMSASG